MRKGLEALEKLTNYGYSKMSEKIKYKEIIEKELKALEIIKKHGAYLGALKMYKTVEEYNEAVGDNMTQEEYELLKKVLQ